MALATLDCNVRDPLKGYDDPTRPFVSCSQDRAAKYVLGPAIIEGTQIDTATGQQSTQGAGWVVNMTFKSQGSSTWGRTPRRTSARAPRSCWTARWSPRRRSRRDHQPHRRSPASSPRQSASGLAGVLQVRFAAAVLRPRPSRRLSRATLGLAYLRAGLIAGGIGLRWCSSTACSTTGCSG